MMDDWQMKTVVRKKNMMNENAELSARFYYPNGLEHVRTAFDSLRPNDLDLRERIPDLLSSCSDTFSLLDIGCGLGKVAAVVQQLYPHATVHGTDFSTKAIVRAGELVAGVRFTQGDEMLEGFDDSAFDFATCRMSFHHYPDPLKHFAAIARVLKQDGRYLIMDILPETKHDAGIWNDIFHAGEQTGEGDGHFRFYTASQYQAMAFASGFEVRFQSPSPFNVSWPQGRTYYDAICKGFISAPVSFREKTAFQQSADSFQFSMPFSGVVLKCTRNAPNQPSEATR